MPERKSETGLIEWWRGLPGVLKGLAAVIAASVPIILAIIALPSMSGTPTEVEISLLGKWVENSGSEPLSAERTADGLVRLTGEIECGSGGGLACDSRAMMIVTPEARPASKTTLDARCAPYQDEEGKKRDITCWLVAHPTGELIVFPADLKKGWINFSGATYRSALAGK